MSIPLTNPKAKIPKGWKQLRRGQIITLGDKYLWYNERKFLPLQVGDSTRGEKYSPACPENQSYAGHHTVIRRIKA